MSENCIVMKLRPKFKELRDDRTYTESDVKTILYAFARDYEHRRSVKPPMRADALKKFIASAFDF